MNLEVVTNSKMIENLGWALLHSIWQIALVAVGLNVLLRLLKNSTSNARYLASVFALALALVLPVLTFIQLSQSIPLGPFSSENAIAKTPMRVERAGSRSAEPLIANAETGPLRSLGQGSLVQSVRALVDENLPYVLPFVVLVWLLGVMAFAARLCGGAWQIHVFKTRGVSGPDVEWQERFSVLCAKLRIKRAVTFLRSDLVKTPIVVGFLKPFVLVPAAIFLQIDPRQLETLLAHELVHIRRHDALVNLAQSMIEPLFFYHPCVWWMSSVIRTEREFAADDAVLNALEDSHIVYANALADLEEIRQLTDQGLPSVVTAANGGNLMKRIQRILQKNTETRVSTSAWSAAFAIALISAVLLSVFSFNQTALVNAQSRGKDKKIAVGFVSIPPLDRSDDPPKDSFATAQLLMEILKSHRIPATGFVNGSSVSDGEKIFPVRAEIVKKWRDEGFEVGLGGFNHLSFYDTPYDQYVANSEKNQAVVKKILGEAADVRYYSYPYLNTGKSVEDRDRFESWLASRGLSTVKYTVDNQEWMYSYAYDMARNDNDLNTMKEIRESFLNYMSKMFDHFETYSREMFGRDIAQTMVLTSSRLVADTGHELFGMLEKRGYKFVPISAAQRDPAYQTAEDFMGKAGISWFERWQMKRGKRLLDEPLVDSQIQRIWEAKKNAPKSEKTK